MTNYLFFELVDIKNLRILMSVIVKMRNYDIFQANIKYCLNAWS